MPTIQMRYPGGLAKAVTLSYDDAVQQDAQLIEILDKNGLKGTFNINTSLFAPEGTVYPAGKNHRRMTESEAIRVFKESGHEVAVHTATHPFLEQLSQPNVTWEVLADKKRIEDLFGGICRGMAYPFGTTSDMVVESLKTCGILYARTTNASCSIEFPSDWLRLRPTCHHKAPQLMEYADRLVNQTTKRSPWLLYVWGHTYEFDEQKNWDVIEKFAEFVGGKDDIWYATNIEIFEYAEAYGQLQFSACGDRVFNPTCRELFFYELRKGKNYSVKPGETVAIEI